MGTDDQKIVSLCKKNSSEGFDMLYQAYHRYVYTICYRSTYNTEDAKDLLQEVFIKVYRNIGSFAQSKPLLPWIRKITVNVCINHKQRAKTENLSLDLESFRNTVSAEEDIQSTVISGLMLSSVEKAVSTLPANERMAVILRHFDERSYDEIAGLMDRPVGTIKTYLYRGRRMIRDKLKQEGFWEV